ncbi:hypothetical protein Tco_0731981 [Tanacetum coccineum]
MGTCKDICIGPQKVSQPFMKCFGNYFLIVTVCSGYLSLMTTFSSTLVKLRTPFVLAGGVSLIFFIPYFILLDSCVENTFLIPLAVWNLMALWMVETTITIFCIAVLPSNILYGESDLTMTKLRFSLLARGASPIVISRGISLLDQDFLLKPRLEGLLSLSWML